MPSVTVQDNGDGTATATIGDMQPGELWSLAVSAAASLPGAWATVDTGNGNGQSVFSVANGGHFALLLTPVSSQFSDVFYFVAYDASVTPVWQQCLLTTRDTIRLMALPGVDSTRVVAYKVPLDRQLARVIAGQATTADGSPAIIVSPVSEQVVQSEQLAGRIIRRYGCAVAMLRGDRQDPDANLTEQLDWRDRIFRAFHEQNPLGIGAVNVCYVEPGQVFPLEAWLKNYDVQGLVIRCRACEART